MKFLDRFLQDWRIRKAAAFLKDGDFILDIGTADGALFRKLPKIKGIGIDTNPIPSSFPNNAEFRQGFLEDAIRVGEYTHKFDAVTLLAVMEHIKRDDQETLAKHLANIVKPDGLVILTIPAPIVDHILEVLKFLRLIDGMEDGQHYGFDVGETAPLFIRHGFELHVHRRFQLGVNHVFVFRKRG